MIQVIDRSIIEKKRIREEKERLEREEKLRIEKEERNKKSFLKKESLAKKTMRNFGEVLNRENSDSDKNGEMKQLVMEGINEGLTDIKKMFMRDNILAKANLKATNTVINEGNKYKGREIAKAEETK